VEACALQPCQLWELLSKLLHAIFAEQPLASGVGFKNRFGWKGFAYCHQRNLVRVAPGAACGRENVLANQNQLFRNTHEISV